MVNMELSVLIWKYTVHLKDCDDPNDNKRDEKTQKNKQLGESICRMRLFKGLYEK